MGNSDLYNSYKTDLMFEGNKVEIFEFKGQVLFNPYHVGKCLDLSESRVRDYLSKMNDKQAVLLKNSDVYKTDIRKLNNAGEKFLKEAGVYKLIFKSHKENAERFQDWVTDEVLPSIRKHGAYMTEDTIEKALTSPDFLIQLATKLKEEQEKSKQLEDKLHKNSKMINQIAVSKNSLLVREVAKVLSNEHSIKIGEKQLYKKLREWGWVFQKSTEAKQEAIRRGYLEVREGVRESTKGVFTFHTTRVTGKGQRKILEKLLEELEEMECATNE